MDAKHGPSDAEFEVAARTLYDLDGDEIRIGHDPCVVRTAGGAVVSAWLFVTDEEAVGLADGTLEEDETPTPTIEKEDVALLKDVAMGLEIDNYPKKAERVRALVARFEED